MLILLFRHPQISAHLLLSALPCLLMESVCACLYMGSMTLCFFVLFMFFLIVWQCFLTVVNPPDLHFNCMKSAL